MDHWQVQTKLSARDKLNLRHLASYVRTALGLPPSDLLNWIWLYDELASIRAEGMPLPAGLAEKPSLWDIIDDQERMRTGAGLKLCFTSLT